MARSKDTTTVNPIKKGRWTNTADGHIALTNENNEEYIVDRAVLTIWNLLDGKRSVSDVVMEFSKKSEADPESIEIEMNKIISKLRGADLIS